LTKKKVVINFFFACRVRNGVEIERERRDLFRTNKDPKMEVKGMKLNRSFRGISLAHGLALVLILVSVEAFSASQNPSAPSATAKDLGLAFVGVAKKVLPSVVSIRSEKTVTAAPWEGFGKDFFKGTPFDEFFKGQEGSPQKRRQMGQGSGVIVDATGLVLTNYHVVGEAEKITIRLYDGREFKGAIKGVDPKTDLAVVQIEAAQLPVPALGDSDRLQVGEWAIAIGSPFGLEETVTVGVISAKGRSGLGTGTYEDFIQTDASINPGNSGGPLVNIDGEVIGINVMIIQPGQGIGFAIPINLAKRIMTELIAYGKVTRPWVGIGLQDVTEDLMKQFNLKEKEGALINRVFEGSPAEKAGLRSGDVVIQIDETKIKNSQEVVQEVLKKKVEQTLRFLVLRDGKETEITVTTAPMPAEAAGAKPGSPEKKEWFGLRVRPVTPELAKQLGLSRPDGVVIEKVEPGSAAQEAGLRPGDVIAEVDRRKIVTEEDYRAAMEKVNPEKGALLLINRKGSTLFVPLKEAKQGGDR
jgi:serine protease Do